MNIQKIKLGLLTAKDSAGKWAQFDETGVRECCGPLTICDYADEMTEGSAFPPVVLFYDGQRYWIADGFHRIAAAEQCGFKEIEADVREGTRLDAVWFALGANRQHGRRMTHNDRIAAVKRGVIEFQARSNREIARQIGCDDKTVAAVRASLESTAEIPQLVKTVGKDGKSRPATRKSKAPADDAPAARTGVSFAESYHAPDVPAEDNSRADEPTEGRNEKRTKQANQKKRPIPAALQGAINYVRNEMEVCAANDWKRCDRAELACQIKSLLRLADPQ